MLTAAQVAEQLGLKPRTVYDLDPAKLPRYRFGGAIRYDQADVDAYKASCREAPPPRARLKMPTVSVRDLLTPLGGESDLVDVFRRHGIEPRFTPMTGRLPKKNGNMYLRKQKA